MSAPEKFYYEAKVAEQLGVSRNELRYVREEILKKNRGEWRLHGRDVVISQGALEKVLKYLASSSHGKFDGIDFAGSMVDAGEKTEPAVVYAGPAEKGKSSLPPAVPVELTVKKVFLNPKLLLATSAELGDVRVKVKSNRNFRPKMKIKARPGEGKLYKLEGRAPRFPGRY